jgi:hypothetical protein
MTEAIRSETIIGGGVAWGSHAAVFLARDPHQWMVPQYCRARLRAA